MYGCNRSIAVFVCRRTKTNCRFKISTCITWTKTERDISNCTVDNVVDNKLIMLVLRLPNGRKHWLVWLKCHIECWFAQTCSERKASETKVATACQTTMKMYKITGWSDLTRMCCSDDSTLQGRTRIGCTLYNRDKWVIDILRTACMTVGNCLLGKRESLITSTTAICCAFISPNFQIITRIQCPMWLTVTVQDIGQVKLEIVTSSSILFIQCKCPIPIGLGITCSRTWCNK
mmetsp:Transcript_3598/g.5356  ORF Transcript_3598/g.5356 Transcript_3598/m.5356 type:complete len:232 (+) Transcript_3598:1350-2045(+)